MRRYVGAAIDPLLIKEVHTAVYRGKCILVIGPGLSTQAWTEDGEHPPDWKSLLERMTQWCSAKGLVDPDSIEDISTLIHHEHLIEAAQEIEELLKKNRQEQQCLRDVLLCDQAKASEIHSLIAQIPFRAYLTTYYDTFIEMAYRSVKGKDLQRFYETSIQDAITAYREDRPFILKLHGDIDNLDSIILSDRTFERRLHRASNYWRDLEKLLGMSFILFIEFGNIDYDLFSLINKIDVFNTFNTHWMVIPEGQLPTLKAKRLREDKGIRIVQYKDDETHSELIQFLKELATPLLETRLEQGVRVDRPKAITKTESLEIPQLATKTDLFVEENAPLSSTSAPKRTFQVFYCYASNARDENLRKKLDMQLSSLRRHNVIDTWYPLKIGAGEEWEHEIHKHLDSADIILLLISPDFMASDFIAKVQLQQALERHNSEKARVIPIILRPVLDWKEESFGKLQPLPKNENPVTRWSDEDEAFVHIADGIKAAIKDLQDKS